MNIQQMRNKVSGAYDSVIWRNKVYNMPDNQVIAIYKTMVKSDRFVKVKKDKTCEQLSMF